MHFQAGRSQVDAVWIYTLTYGGGIVSGDCISFDLTIEDHCTAVLTTQASTKVKHTSLHMHTICLFLCFLYSQILDTLYNPNCLVYQIDVYSFKALQVG